MDWFIVDTEMGDTAVDLEKVCSISIGYHYDNGWADEERCHTYPTTFHMDNGEEVKLLLLKPGHKALLEKLK